MLAYTLSDFMKLNPDYQKRYDPKTKTAYVGNAKTGKEISFLEGQGQQYGLGALQDGSHTISDPSKLIAALSSPTTPATPVAPQPAKYESPYTGKIGETLAAIQNRPAFSYDPSKDVGLQTAQGNAIDAVSRAAGRRNMLYSDSNKSQMGKASLALVPQFRQQALGEYQQQGQDLYNQLNPLLQLENTAYGQYRDTVGDTRYADTTAYNRGRDVISDTRYTDETGYNRNQDALKNQMTEAALSGKYKGKLIPEVRSTIATITGIDPETGKPTLAKIKADRDQANERARIGVSRISAGRDAANTKQSDLFKIWQNTGKAPAGIPGVPVGTPLYDKVDERQSIDPVMETAISLALKDDSFAWKTPEEQQKRIDSLYAQLSKGRALQPKTPTPITGLDKDILDALK